MDNKQKIDEEVKKVKEQVKDIIDYDKIEELLGNNQIEFDYNKIKYRVTRPTFKQKQEANEQRMVKQTYLLRQVDAEGKPKFLMEKDFIEEYKKRGIDINAMNVNFDKLQKQNDDYMFKLGRAIKEKKEEKDLKVLRDEIDKTWKQQQEISMEKAVLLDSCIESQVNVYIYTYLTYLIAEKQIDKKWIKAWDSFDDFMNSDEKLVNMAVFNASFFAKNELPIF